jgi:hypothetical protein
MTFGRCADFCVGGGLDASPASGWCDQPAPAMVRREYAVVTSEVDAGFGYQGSQTGNARLLRYAGNTAFRKY